MREARFVITDSGGVQEETTALGTSCLTVRDTTERPITIEQGTNVLVGTSLDALIVAVDDILEKGGKTGRVPPLWDGKAAERIAAEIDAYLSGSRVPMLAS
jgi:UDP-N-acetylglucosamine 2-epimerase (non-hydrolysing)